MWMNYDDFTRTKRTNAISQVNGIASEYVRRLDDEPSKKLYDGRTRFQAFMAHNDEVINIVTAINIVIIINLLQQDKSPNPT